MEMELPGGTYRSWALCSAGIWLGRLVGPDGSDRGRHLVGLDASQDFGLDLEGGD